MLCAGLPGIITGARTKGDVVDIELPMPVRKVLADDRGMDALQRGPLVYCAEGIDNSVCFEPVTTLALRLEIQLPAQTYRQGLLGPPDANWMREDAIWHEGGLSEWRIHN